MNGLFLYDYPHLYPKRTRQEIEGFKQTVKGRWQPQQESNLYLSLRRTALYPFNYGADVRNSNRN